MRLQVKSILFLFYSAQGDSKYKSFVDSSKCDTVCSQVHVNAASLFQMTL